MAARFQNNGRKGRVVASDASLLSSGAIGVRPVVARWHGGAAASGRDASAGVGADARGAVDGWGDEDVRGAASADRGAVAGNFASGHDASAGVGADARGAADSRNDEEARGVVSAGVAPSRKVGRGKLVAHRRDGSGHVGPKAGLDAADTQSVANGDGPNAAPAPKTPRLGFARPIRLAVIGAGKVGCSMARYLSSGPSVEVVGFYSRNPLASEEAANFAGGRIFATAADAVRAAEVILVTTPDGAIADVWNQLCAEAGTHAVVGISSFGTTGKSVVGQRHVPGGTALLAHAISDGDTDGRSGADYAEGTVSLDGFAVADGSEEGLISAADGKSVTGGSSAGRSTSTAPAGHGNDPTSSAAKVARSTSSAAAAYLAQRPAQDAEPLRLAGKIFVHCSGACPSAVFEGAAELGAQAVSMHPIYAISSRFDCWRELEQAWFSLEGDAYGASVLEALLRAKGNHVMRVEPQDKSRYHLAAVMASNLVVSLYHMAASELSQCGVSQQDAEAALAPLFLGNANHIAEDGVEASITGPAARGDWDTLNAHLVCLDDDPRRLAAYRALTDELIALTRPDTAPGGVSTPAWDIDEA